MASRDTDRRLHTRATRRATRQLAAEWPRPPRARIPLRHTPHRPRRHRRTLRRRPLRGPSRRTRRGERPLLTRAPQPPLHAPGRPRLRPPPTLGHRRRAPGTRRATRALGRDHPARPQTHRAPPPRPPDRDLPPDRLRLHRPHPRDRRGPEQPDLAGGPRRWSPHTRRHTPRRTTPRPRRRHHPHPLRDRKSTRLNSSHVAISYAVFCLKKKKPNLDVCI